MWLFQRRTPGQGAFAMAGSDSISLRVRQTPGRCQINAPQPRHGRRPRTKLIPMPIIKVEMLKGRTLEQKRELADVMTREYVRIRSEEHTSELQSLMRISYAVFCLNKKTTPHPAISNTCHPTHRHREDT